MGVTVSFQIGDVLAEIIEEEERNQAKSHWEDIENDDTNVEPDYNY